jgi:hypothetical protein
MSQLNVAESRGVSGSAVSLICQEFCQELSGGPDHGPGAVGRSHNPWVAGSSPARPTYTHKHSGFNPASTGEYWRLCQPSSHAGAHIPRSGNSASGLADLAPCTRSAAWAIDSYLTCA